MPNTNLQYLHYNPPNPSYLCQLFLLWGLVAHWQIHRLSSEGSQVRIPLWPPCRDLRASSSPTMLCITIASAQPRRESALLSLACIRKKGDIKYQLYCIVFIIYSTTSFNPFLLHPYTALSFRHLITKILKSLCSHLCPVSLEQTPTSVTDKNI